VTGLPPLHLEPRNPWSSGRSLYSNSMGAFAARYVAHSHLPCSLSLWRKVFAPETEENTNAYVDVL
jgi:hypothetical protein